MLDLIPFFIYIYSEAETQTSAQAVDIEITGESDAYLRTPVSHFSTPLSKIGSPSKLYGL